MSVKVTYNKNKKAKNKEVVLNSNNEPIKDMQTILTNVKAYLEIKKRLKAKI